MVKYLGLKTPFFLIRRILPVSAKQRQRQGATTFHSEPFQRQYGRGHVIGRVTERTYRRAI
jgi:hypothetical protein